MSGRDIEPFDPDKTTWKMWLMQFEEFLITKSIDKELNPRTKLAFLKFKGGKRVCEILHYVPMKGEESDHPIGWSVSVQDEYAEAISRLNDYLKQLYDPVAELMKFRELKQKPAETAKQFEMRLRHQAERCEFQNSNQEILIQFIQGTTDMRIKTKYSRKKLRILEEVIEEASRNETLFKPEASVATPSEVFAVQQRTNHPGKDVTCFKCGQKGHYASVHARYQPYQAQNDKAEKKSVGAGQASTSRNSDRPPVKCFACGGVGHIKRNCGNLRQGSEKIAAVSEQENQSQEAKAPKVEADEYLFFLGGGHTVECVVGGVKLDMILDTGCKSNIITLPTWLLMKAQGAKVFNAIKNPNKSFKAFGQKDKLPVVGAFEAQLKIDDKEKTTKFYVVDVQDSCLLGSETAEEMKLIKINAKKKPFPCIKGIEVHIPLDENARPIVQAERRIPLPLEDAANEELDELEALEIIEKVPGYSPWISSAVWVEKENGEKRLCVDMRAVNAAVLKETHPLPTFEQITGRMHGSTVFSVLDVARAFHQLIIAESSRVITTFRTHRGLYRYCRLMFGLSSAAEIFQRTMETILQGLEGVEVYVDDVVVYGRDKKEHDMRLRAVLDRLAEYNVKLNIAKCQIGKSCVEFLGHTISATGVRPTEEKIDKIKNWREPKDKSEVQSLLGLIQYVGARCIPNLAFITEPLRVVAAPNTVFKWGQEQKDAFEQIKKELESLTELAFYSKADRTMIYADASPSAVGVVLIQISADGDPRIVNYASRTLNAYEKRLSQTEKEAVAIVWGVERNHMFVYGREFELITDHKPLEVIFGPRHKPSLRLERLQIRIQAYNYKIRYIPGKVMIADIFSRLHIGPETVKEEEPEIALIATVQETLHEAVTFEELEEGSASDPVIQEVRKALIDQTWNERIAVFKQCQEEFFVVGEVLMRGHRIVLPESVRARVMAIAHKGHPGVGKMKAKLRQRYWYPGMDKDVENYAARCLACKLVATQNPPIPMKRTEMPDNAWEFLGIDLFGPLPEGEQLLVVIDYFSRYFEVCVLTKIETEDVTRALDDIFARFGIPIRMQADNGPQFKSREFEKYCKDKGIRLTHSPPYYPRVNGEVERQMRSLKKVLTIAFNQGNDWRKALTEFLFTYRTTPHTVTGISPAELLLKRRPRDQLPSIPTEPDASLELRDQDKMAKEKGKKYGDQRHGARDSKIQEGDWVLAKRMCKKTKFDSNFNQVPCVVTERNGPEAVIQSNTGNTYRRSLSHLTKIPTPNQTEEEQRPEQDDDSSDSQDTEMYGTNPATTEQTQRATASPGNETARSQLSSFCPPVQSTPIHYKPKRTIRKPAWLLEFTAGDEVSLEEGRGCSDVSEK